jgi:hypothetical protein
MPAAGAPALPVTKHGRALLRAMAASTMLACPKVVQAKALPWATQGLANQQDRSSPPGGPGRGAVRCGAGRNTLWESIVSRPDNPLRSRPNTALAPHSRPAASGAGIASGSPARDPCCRERTPAAPVAVRLATGKRRRCRATRSGAFLFVFVGR